MCILAHAVLLIPDSQEEKFIVVPVANFPLLPPDSEINIYFGEKAWIEGGKIVAYTAHSGHGTEVEINIRQRPDSLDDDSVDTLWQRVAVHCVPDPGSLGSLYYPETIDFGTSYPKVKK